MNYLLMFYGYGVAFSAAFTIPYLISDFAVDSFFGWIIASLTFGGAIGVITGLLLTFAGHCMSRKKPQENQHQE